MSHDEQLAIFNLHYRVAYWTVKRLRRKSIMIARLPLEDANQTALLALWECIPRWKPEVAKFCTFAPYCIWHELQNAARVQISAVTVPGVCLSPKQMDGQRKAETIRKALQAVRSTGASTHGRLKEMFGLTRDDQTPQQDAEMDARAVLELSNLERQELLILRLRILEGWTLERIGKRIRLTRERVRQIEKAAKAKLRRQWREDR